MSKRRPIAGTLCWALMLPWLAHCASLQRPEGEVLYRGGSLERAAAFYERVVATASSPRAREEALFRLTTIYAAPGPTFDPVRSQVRLDGLLREFPRTRFETEARILGALTERLLTLEAGIEQAEARVVGLSAASAGCQRTIEEIADDRRILLQLGTEESASRRSCEAALAALRRRIQTRDLEIARLKEAMAALERLRRIDTESNPGRR